MRYLLLLLLTAFVFEVQAQKIEVYDFEKIASPYYGCTIYVCTVNKEKKQLSIEHKMGTSDYTKAQAKEFIDGLENLLTIKVEQTEQGKREAMLTLSDNDTRILLYKKDAIVKFSSHGATSLLPEYLPKLLEGIKKAYEKL